MQNLQFKESIEYVPLTDGVLKYLYDAKISKLLKSIRLSIFEGLQKQQWSYGISFQLHPILKKYFPNLNEFSGRFKDFENEPKEIVELKKIFNLWFTIEKTLEAVEHTDAIFHLDTPMRFHAIQEQIHEAVRELLELDIQPLSSNLETFSGVEYFVTAALSLKSYILVIYNDSNQHTQRTIQNLPCKLSAYLEHILVPQNLAKDVGFMAGVSIDLLSPYDNAHFIGQFISLLPFSMLQISSQIKYLTQQMAEQQSHISSSEWKRLEDNLETIFDNIAHLESNPFYFSMRLTSILYHVRQLYNFYKMFVGNIGRFSTETQAELKIKLRYLKHDLLLNFKVSLDLFETDLMLAPGSITDKIFPHIENLYHDFIGLVNAVIEFQKSDEDIYYFYEKKWYEGLINAHHQVMAKRKVEALLSKDKIETLTSFVEHGHEWTPIQIKNTFGLFGAYLAKIDAKLFNEMHAKICKEFIHLDELLPDAFRDREQMFEVLGMNDDILKNYVSRVFDSPKAIRYENAAQLLRRQMQQDYQDIIIKFQNSRVLPKLKQAIMQECSSWELREKISESSIEYIQQQNQHVAYVIKIKRSNPAIQFDEVADQFNGFYGLIGVVVQPVEIHEDVDVITNWYWVDKCQRTIRPCKETTILQQIKSRPLKYDAPQKLTAQEILGLQRMGLGDCLFQIKGPDSQADAMLLVNIPENQEEHGLKQQLINSQYTLSRREMSKKACCDFFNIFARIKPEKIISSLSNEKKIQLQNLLNQFELLIRDADEANCSALYFGLDVQAQNVAELTVQQVMALKTGWLDHITSKIEAQKEIITEVMSRFSRAYGRDASNQLVHVEREDYFLKNTDHSEFFKGWQDYFKKIFQIYNPTISQLFTNPQGHIYDNLHQPDLILLEPQQIVEQKLLFNVLGQIQAFCENLETYQISNFDENYFKLHLDIIIGYLNFSNLTFFYFKTEHHFDLLKRFMNLVYSRWEYLMAKKDYYDPKDVELKNEVKECGDLHLWIHRLFSLPPIINNLNEPTSLSSAQLRDMSQEYLNVSQKVADVLLHTNSYWWVFWHIPSIKQLIVEIKDKFQEASHALHTKTIANLYDLKLILFKGLMLECDEIELDLGIKSELFSDQVHLIVDVLFENLLYPLDVEMSKLAKLTLRDDLYVARLEGLKILERRAKSLKSSLRTELQDIQQFEIEPSEYHFEKILPILVKYNKCRAYPPKNATPEDQKFKAWIKDICEQNVNLSGIFEKQNINFTSDQFNNILELKSFVKNALQGLIATEDLKIQCCREKIEHVDRKQQEFINQSPQKIKDIIHDKVSYHFKRVANNFKEFHPTILKEYLDLMMENLEARRTNFEEQLLPVVEEQMNQITSIHSNEVLFEGAANELCFNLINACVHEFVENHYSNYCHLHDVLISIQRLQAHLEAQRVLLNENQFLWFDDENSLNQKLRALDSIKTELLDTSLLIPERLDRVHETILKKAFRSVILNYTYSSNWSITLLVQYFWAFMSYLGLYQTETQKLFKELKCEMNPIEEQVPQLEKYGLFVQKDVSYQDHIVQGIRQELIS